MVPSPPPVPKKARTKVLVSKATPNASIKEKPFKGQTDEALCHKVKYLLPEDNLHLYQENF